MSGYNGWSNYETWRVNLEMFDGVLASDLGIRLDADSDTAAEVDIIAELLEQEASEIIESEAVDGFARSLALDFLSRVDWVEIAEHVVSDELAAVD
jgi:hypothetical protein